MELLPTNLEAWEWVQTNTADRLMGSKAPVVEATGHCPLSVVFIRIQRMIKTLSI